MAAAPVFGNIFSETFNTSASLNGWTVAGDPQNETSLVWLDGGGNPGGALEFGGYHNGQGAGRGYNLFHTVEGLNLTGATSLSFDARLTAASIGTNVQVRLTIPGVSPAWHSLSNNGLNNDWTTFTYDLTGTTPGSDTFRIDYLVAAGAFEGAGARIAVDNLTIVPEPSTYAAVLGFLTLGAVLLHRRRRQS